MRFSCAGIMGSDFRRYGGEIGPWVSDRRFIRKEKSMLKIVAVIITALLALSCLMLFVRLKSPASKANTPNHRPRFGTIQLDTAELGELSVGKSGIIAGNARGELRIFPSLSSQAKPRVVPLAKSAILAPVLERDNTYFVGDEDGVFRACDLTQGIKWTFRTGDKIVGSAVWCSDVVLVGSYDQMLYALDPKSGALRYKIECGSYINGSPVLSPSGDAVFLGSCDGILRKIDAVSGHVIANINLGSPIPASPVLADGILYAVTHDGDLAAVNADSFALLYRVKLPVAYTSLPYLAGDLIFLTDSAGHITAHSRHDGKLLSVVEPKEKMTPLQAGGPTAFYAVSTRGKLYEYKQDHASWTKKLLHDFQTDCRQSCRLFRNSLIIADENGGLYFYEVTP